MTSPARAAPTAIGTMLFVSSSAAHSLASVKQKIYSHDSKTVYHVLHDTICICYFVCHKNWEQMKKNKSKNLKIKKSHKLYTRVYICILSGNKNYYSTSKVIWVSFFECLVLNLTDSQLKSIFTTEVYSRFFVTHVTLVFACFP